MGAGLGLRLYPTGHGLWRSFMTSDLDWIQREYPGMGIRLCVASFNQRVIKMHESLRSHVVPNCWKSTRVVNSSK